MNGPDNGKHWYMRLLVGVLSVLIVALVLFFVIQTSVHAQRQQTQTVAQASGSAGVFLAASDLPDIW